MTDRRRPATLGDVADLAGVSQSTVSNVVRGADVVAPPTRRRVEAAIDQLGYRPNALARQLLSGRATTVGIIARDLANPFIAEMASLVEREVARYGFATMFSATEGVAEGEDRAVDLMLEYRISGVVMLSYLRRPGAIRDRIAGQFASVFIAAEEPWADSISIDERRAGGLVARHVIDLGHCRLAFVGPHRRDRADSGRFEGFVRAAEGAGLQPTIIAWDPPDGPPSVGGRIVDWPEVLQGRDRPTAIFAANDFAAIDLLDVADSLGIGVPQDLSVVGFDDVDVARLRRISLTTVGQPREQLVRLGVQSLLDRISGRIVGESTLTQVPVELKIRGSTGPAP
jgi:LacI family transcriptional regulator